MLPISILAIIKLNKQDSDCPRRLWLGYQPQNETDRCLGDNSPTSANIPRMPSAHQSAKCSYLIIILLIAIIGYTGKRIYSRYAAKAEKAAVQEVQQAPTPPVAQQTRRAPAAPAAPRLAAPAKARACGKITSY